MSQAKPSKAQFLFPTPAGAYYAVAEAVETPPRKWLGNLLRCLKTPRLTRETLEQLGEDFEQSLALLRRIHSLRWVQGLDAPLAVPDQPLEELLPRFLAHLTEEGAALLADSQGFYLASNGFPHETAEELAALSAELTSLQDRYAGLVLNNLNLGTQAWGLIDAGGNSRLGIWPLYIGRHRFVLVMTGIPHFNHPDFVRLVWSLMTRYAPSPLWLE
jgi:hypothetical protein